MKNLIIILYLDYTYLSGVSMTKLSATIITYNEEANIERCLKSLTFVDEIIVVDSLSQDRTAEICQRFGAKVYFQKFLGYGQQKNLAASYTNNNWIFNIDADEVVTDQLRKSILSAIDKHDHCYVYKVKRLTNYCGKWIRYGGWYPNAVLRLYEKNHIRWTEPNLHEVLAPIKGELKSKTLDGDLLHYSFPTVKSQVMTNVKYAELGSFDLVQRKGRKPYFFELLTRPFGKFLECYLVKRGFLDGKEGLVIALNASYSMFMKYSFAYFRD